MSENRLQTALLLATAAILLGTAALLETLNNLETQPASVLSESLVELMLSPYMLASAAIILTLFVVYWRRQRATLERLALEHESLENDD